MNKKHKSRHPYKTASTENLKERKTQILDLLQIPENIIRSSLITCNIKCGKANCRCAKGEGHKNFYLSSYYHGHTYMDYVSKPIADKVADCIHSYEKIYSLIVELSEINLELFRRKELEL